jgi:acetate---CoA ligase (ADP-forming)
MSLREHGPVSALKSQIVVESASGVDLILRPRSIAIVGASESGRWSRTIFEHLRDGGYRGSVSLINPRRDRVWGEPCFPDFSSLPIRAEHAVVLTSQDSVVDVLIEGARSGLKSAVVYASSIGDGEHAASMDRANELKAAIAEHGLRLCGPNTLGTVSVRERAILFPDPALREVRPGGIGAVFQSGGILQFWMKTMSERGGDFSYGIASGNELDCDLPEYLDFLTNDPHTRVLALFIEGIRRPDAFRSACERALEAGKPIVAIKTGRSQRGKVQALSHTGALAGDDQVFDAFCERYGIARCRSLDEMVEVTLAFQGGRLPRGPRAGFVMHSGGMKGLILDEAESQGIEFGALHPDTMQWLSGRLTPDLKIENPLDASMAAALDPAQHASICIAFARDPNIDILALNAVLPRGPSRGNAPSYRSILESTDKPVIGIARMDYRPNDGALAYQAETGFPYLQGIPETVRAVRALVEYAGRRCRPLPEIPLRPGSAANLNADTFSNVLETQFNVPLPRTGFARDSSDVAAIADSIGYPVALKVRSPEILHKTEFGAVVTGLRSTDEVVRAAQAMTERVRQHLPGAVLDGFVVQEMVEGIEIIVGARTDVSFGPYLLVGLGGVFVELMQQTKLICLPLDLHELDRTLAAPPFNKVLAGFRSRRPADLVSLRSAIIGIAEFYLAHRKWLTELEINPLIVREHGQSVAAVDIRAVAARNDRQKATG